MARLCYETMRFGGHPTSPRINLRIKLQQDTKKHALFIEKLYETTEII